MRGRSRTGRRRRQLRRRLRGRSRRPARPWPRRGWQCELSPLDDRTLSLDRATAPSGPLRTIEPVIYCVVPHELEAELYDKLVEHYNDNPNVTVIVDRREGDNRRPGREYGGKREIRDRRRPRALGTFLTTEPPEGSI